MTGIKQSHGVVGGVGGEGVLRGVALEVGDTVPGGVPYMFCGIQGQGRITPIYMPPMPSTTIP